MFASVCTVYQALLSLTSGRVHVHLSHLLFLLPPQGQYEAALQIFDSQVGLRRRFRVFSIGLSASTLSHACTDTLGIGTKSHVLCLF